MGTSLVPAVQIAGGKTTCLATTLFETPLAIRIYAKWNIFLCFTIYWWCIGGWIHFCLPIPWLGWCGEQQYDLFTWSANALAIPILSKLGLPLVFYSSNPYVRCYADTCNPAPDGSAPVAGWVQVVQSDYDTLAVSWGGAFDRESGVSSYLLSVGYAPGAANYISTLAAGVSQSAVLKGLASRIGDGAAYYATGTASSCDLDIQYRMSSPQ
jgi:hypothetical protein